jgi:hypothetical protein
VISEETIGTLTSYIMKRKTGVKFVSVKASSPQIRESLGRSERRKISRTEWWLIADG